MKYGDLTRNVVEEMVVIIPVSTAWNDVDLNWQKDGYYQLSQECKELWSKGVGEDASEKASVFDEMIRGDELFVDSFFDETWPAEFNKRKSIYDARFEHLAKEKGLTTDAKMDEWEYFEAEESTNYHAFLVNVLMHTFPSRFERLLSEKLKN